MKVPKSPTKSSYRGGGRGRGSTAKRVTRSQALFNPNDTSGRTDLENSNANNLLVGRNKNSETLPLLNLNDSPHLIFKMQQIIL